MHAAYLVVTLDVTGVAPCVKDVGIFSSNGSGLTTSMGEVRADVLKVEDPSFDEAHKRLVAMVNKSDHYAWVRPWVASGIDGYEGQENLRNCLRVAAAMVGAKMSRSR